MNGLVLVDKPGGLTSHDVVNRMRRIAGTKRVGHLGTLDPMATGLLSIVVGTATRLAPFYEKETKAYQGTIQFGVVSDTYDAEGQMTATGAGLPAEGKIREALELFRGRFLQKPPPVSAKKVGGVPAYKLVRRKVAVDLAPVEVEITRLELLAMDAGQLEVEVSCAAGTYIRSLAHDLGERLGCGAILTRLRRTQAGGFSIAEARTLEQLADLSRAGRLPEAVIPAGQLLAHLPVEHVNEAVEVQIRQGRQFRVSPFVVPPGSPMVRVLSRSGELIAIGNMIVPNLYHPGTVFQG